MPPKIILTADRSWMSSYNDIIFTGFATCFPRKYIPDFVFYRMFAPSVEYEKDGIVKQSPYGLRKIEAALIEYGFNEEDIAVVQPTEIHRFAKDAKVVGICGNDIMGKGPTTRILTQLIEAPQTQAFSASKFRELINSLENYKHLKKIVGGPGSWQLINEKVNADTIVLGEGELVVGELFEKALKGEPLPRIIEGRVVDVDKIPLIRKPSICGLVEIARGCGRGCKFCSPTMRNFRCYPIKKIISEIQVNQASGEQHVILHAEDVIRYKANKINVNPEEVIKLFRAVTKITEPKNVSISHLALSSALQEPKLIEQLSEILELGSKDSPWISGQTGIETASIDLIKKHMQGKTSPFKPEQWKNVVHDSFQLLHDNNWVPCATLIMGLPGEKEQDMVETIELIEDLRNYKSLIIPLFFVPMEATQLQKEEGFTKEKMSYAHWELLAVCNNHSIKWIRVLGNDILKKSNPATRYGLSMIMDIWDMAVGPYMNNIIHEKEVILPGNNLDLIRTILSKRAYGTTIATRQERRIRKQI